MTADPWTALADRLARLLTRREADDFLILHAGPYYVQCYQGPAELYAEALANRSDFPPVRLPAAAEQRLRDLGWQPPDGPDENWTTRLPFPASHRQARALADRMLTTLREVYQVGTITDLRYEATNARAGTPWNAAPLGLLPAG
ncbi:hypothetical protein ACWT_4501 [Actinoplanes sp. SE50]|uniref:TY-Chap domain-containing protein n=1 Tax=unclassified Actinoplanes TaxID=2626549 RepID=UPI00023ECEE6|nr:MULTISPECIES: hypothetical protein [unclassified Actinoplanes]AEV85523.1 hypothetical protein ACPL_4632 [Actinoplanes sp. SE50/110]ATO83916.1 hypothetical protein ACWT_4501 [Actinoplanes sp. SE50]SLM01326.1 hypothetical protein ACSP50_4562 [Actinoplanes sp. SE50/110]